MTARTDLFDVVISASAVVGTHELVFVARIYDKYSDGPGVLTCIGDSGELASLEGVIGWVRGEVAALLSAAGFVNNDHYNEG